MPAVALPLRSRPARALLLGTVLLVAVCGFVYELVIIQEVRPGPMEVRFAPES
jgi:hypothetical protein